MNLKNSLIIRIMNHMNSYNQKQEQHTTNGRAEDNPNNIKKQSFCKANYMKHIFLLKDLYYGKKI